MQQRALAYQSKALSHMLQRELYTMGNSVLIRQRRRNVPSATQFWRYQTSATEELSICSYSFVAFSTGEGLTLGWRRVPPQESNPKTLSSSSPIKTSPFVFLSTTRKEVPSGYAPTGNNSMQAAISHFPAAGETGTTEVTKKVVLTLSQGQRVGNPSSQ